MTQFQHYIGGKRVRGTDERTIDIFDPATGSVRGKAPLASAGEVEHAVHAAHAALPEWSSMTPLRRARILYRFKNVLEQHADELASLITREHGKTHDDALGKIQRGMEVVEFACGGPHLLKGEMTDSVGVNVDSHSLRQPLGVVAGITPFNFPVMVPLWMFPVAIACGNTFVLKPSERAPSAPTQLAELLSEAGAPDGVLNVVHGDRVAVDALLEHELVQAVSFVGSTNIARYIYATGAANGKRVQALGGAKNHVVIMPDADLDKAADALAGAAFGSAGERCMAISVAVPVTDAVADELVARLKSRVATLRVGPGDDEDTEMGPLVSREHLEKVTGYIDNGVSEGAELIVDGRNFEMDRDDYREGFFIGATIFDRVTNSMRIYNEEIFGPVLSIVRAPDYRSAVDLVNGHEYGNGAAIFTRDGDSARSFASEIQAGMVGVNVPIPVPMAFHSFGGWKNSLFGGHHMYGPEGVRFCTKLKTITSRWPKGMKSGADFAMPAMK